MMACRTCGKITRSVKLVKAIITAAEVHSLPLSETRTPPAPCTVEEFQQLSARVADISNARSLSPPTPVHSADTDDQIKALKDELEKMGQQIKDLQYENNVLKTQPPQMSRDTVQPTSETEVLFREFMAQQTAINEANRAATSDTNNLLSKVLNELMEKGSRPAQNTATRAHRTTTKRHRL